MPYLSRFNGLLGDSYLGLFIYLFICLFILFIYLFIYLFILRTRRSMPHRRYNVF